MASVDLPRPVYSALNGEEIKRMVLEEMRVYLDNDTRFKRSVAYHLPQYTIRVDLSSQGQTPEEVILRGTPPIRTLEAEKQHLADVIEALQQKHQEALDYEKAKHARLVEKLDAQIEKLQQQVAEAIRVLLKRRLAPRLSEQRRLIREDAESFFVPAYLGSKGWIAIRLGLAEVDWETVTELARRAFQSIAPRKLAAFVE